jgi:hypothetical protein
MKTLAHEPDRSELLRRLRTVRPESVRRWGRMSAHQMVCHLADAFLMATGEKPVRLGSGFLQHSLLKWLVLHAPLPWPPGIDTSPEIDQERGGTRPVDFAADLARVEALMQSLAHAQVDGRPHPVFGRMSRAAWLRWGYLHVDHHLRQFGA